MGRNPYPLNPKPFPRGYKATTEEIINHIRYCIEFYKERLDPLLEFKPFFFKRKWREEVRYVEKRISDLEYSLLELTQPEVIKEMEDSMNG